MSEHRTEFDSSTQSERPLASDEAQRGGPAREFFFPLEATLESQLKRAFGAVYGAGLGIVVSILMHVLYLVLYLHVPDVPLPGWLLFVLPIIVLSLGGAALGISKTSATADIVVGRDGVLVRGRFVPHSKISEVCQERSFRTRKVSVGYDGYTDDKLAAECEFLLRLVDGEVLHLGARWLDDTSEQERGVELEHAIREAHAAWVSGRCEDVGEQIIRRGVRTGLEWLHELRRSRSSATTAYRALAMDAERLSRLLNDSRRTPSERAAAAVVLAAADGATAAGKLRIAAESTANPRLRIALGHVANASADAVIAEALEMLDEVEYHERPQSSRMGPWHA